MEGHRALFRNHEILESWHLSLVVIGGASFTQWNSHPSCFPRSETLSRSKESTLPIERAPSEFSAGVHDLPKAFSPMANLYKMVESLPS